MPVQFLSGGGGGTSDVRTTFADPVTNTCTYLAASSTQLLSQFTIPANYLQANDSLVLTSIIKYLSHTGATTSKSLTLNIRLGTTGTTSDPSLAQVVLSIGNPTTFLQSAVSFIGNLGVPTIGSSGSATLNLKGYDQSVYPIAFTGGTAQTINTTSTLYLSIYGALAAGTGNTLTIAPSGSSLIVSF